MKSFKQFIEESLIIFGKSRYPASGHAVIMAGGAGSGKGFIKNKLLGIEGYNFDVDELKLLATRSPQIISKIKASHNIDLSKMDPSKHKGALNKPSNVATLHDIVANVLNLPNKRTDILYTNIIMSPPDLKPNLIFDVTMKNMDQLRNFTLPIQGLGYDSRNIHLVWVVNDISVAIDQNKKRDRTVPIEILVHTHEGASETMHNIINMGEQISTYLDGAIVLAFNKVGVDVSVQQRHPSNPQSNTPKEFGGKYKGGYVEKANYVYLKRPGEKINYSKLTRELRAKIDTYVPKNISWKA